MNFTTREDIDAPKDVVYAAITDFDRFERRLMRLGIDVLRDEAHPPPETGARWKAVLEWRGRSHDVEAELVSIEPDDGYALEAHSSGLICLAVVDLVPLSRTRTRLMVSVEVRATSFGSRLLLASLRLTSGPLQGRFRRRVAEFAAELPGAAV